MTVTQTLSPASVYPAEVKTFDGEVVITLPDWPEVAAGGADYDEAVRDAVSALEEAALHRLATDQEIPSEIKIKRSVKHRIPLTPYAGLKIALNRWVNAFGHGAQAELAKRMRVDTRTVRQLLAPTRGKASTDRLFEAAVATRMTVKHSLHFTSPTGRVLRAPSGKGAARAHRVVAAKRAKG
jgi:predicted RNase H-like HicB family nuclease